MKNRLVIEAGTELRIPTGKMQGWTLTALDGPPVTVTADGTPLSVGGTIGAGEVVITRGQDGSSNDTWAEFEDGETVTGTPGATGPAGRGIATIAVNAGHLTGTYSDGTTWDAGPLPVGSGGGLDAEAVQDIVGAMLGESQGHYDDAAGTYTVTLPQPRTDEEIQDVVAALLQAGAGITKTYDDAGNVLTLTASGSAAPRTTQAVVFSAPGTAELVLPAGTLYEGVKALLSAAGTVGVYATAEARTSDTSRLTTTPTVEPSVPMRLQLTATAANQSIALDRRGLSGTLYLRSTTAMTLTFTLEEIQ